jgi:hypothetical protein
MNVSFKSIFLMAPLAHALDQMYLCNLPGLRLVSELLLLQCFMICCPVDGISCLGCGLSTPDLQVISGE